MTTRTLHRSHGLDALPAAMRLLGHVLRSIASGVMLSLTAASALAGQNVPIVQPGAPGQKTTTLTAQQAVKLADARYTADDATFMRDMIHHHDQAVQRNRLHAELAAGTR
jgi:uncharacterized protein (DUF305 family)